MNIAILATGLFVFLAHLLDTLFRAKKIPDILILMILGVVAGPVTGVVDLAEIETVGKLVAVITLVVILFESGLNLSIRQVLQAAGRATPFALVSMSGAVAMMCAVFHWFLGMDLWSSLLGGFILGGTSSAVVIPLLKSLGTSEETGTVLTLESALTDVLCIIATVGIATSLSTGEVLETGGLVGSALFSLAMAALLGAVAGIAWMVVTAKIERMRANKFTTLAFALVIYAAGEMMGISGAIIALSFGMTINNTRKGHVVLPGMDEFELRDMEGFERKVYAEIVFLLKAFFFFFLGLTVKPEDFISVAGVAAFILCLIPFLPRWPAVWLFFSQKQTTRRDATIAWALVPRGLAAAVLAQYAAGLGLEHGALLSRRVTMTVFLSITAVAVVILLIERGVLAPLANVSFGSFPLALEGPGDGGETEVDGTQPDHTETEQTKDAEPPSQEASAPALPHPETPAVVELPQEPAAESSDRPLEEAPQEADAMAPEPGDEDSTSREGSS